MKMNILYGALLIVLGALFLSYTNTQESQVLRVGVLAPLTGNFGVLGERIKNGFIIAQEDLAKEGINVEVIVEDACDAKTATAALTKLITADKITFMGGSYCITGLVPAIPILKQHNLIGVNLVPNPDIALNHEHIVSVNASLRQKGTDLGNFAAQQLNAKTAAIIYYNTALGEDYRKYFTAAFETNGGKVIDLEVTQVEQTDFRTELTKVRSLNPDVIFLVQLARPLANLLKQADDLGIQSKILGNSQNEDVTVLEIAGKAAEGFLISSDEPATSTVVLDFNQRYEKRFGQKADVFARNAYDALMLESQAYQKCGAANACLLEFFHAVKDYEGVSGSITIQPDGSAFKRTTFKQVVEGQFAPFIQQ